MYKLYIFSSSLLLVARPAIKKKKKRETKSRVPPVAQLKIKVEWSQG